MAALERALAKGLAFAHNNQDKLRDIYPTFTTLKPDLARKIVLSYTPEKSDFTQLKKIGDLMDRLQMLPGKTQAAGRRNAAHNERLARASTDRAGLGQSGPPAGPTLPAILDARMSRSVRRVRFLLDRGIRDTP